jgi:sugar phosphate permease
VLTGVAPEHAGSASGLLQTFQQLGGAIGLAVIVSVYAAGAEPGQFLPGADHAFLTSAIFALTALLVAVLAVTRVRRRTPVESRSPEVAKAA